LFDLTQNYFSLFDLEPAFDLDLNILSQRYRVIQSQIHPDKFSGGSDQSQRLALQYASRVNEALHCLKDPLERAKYLLTLKGVTINLDTQSHVDSEFLMTQIELREQLAGLASQLNPESGIQSLNHKIDQKIADLSSAFVGAYHLNENQLALDAVVKWQFLVKLRRDVSTFEESL
jgi:molecular chaperone HscB